MNGQYLESGASAKITRRLTLEEYAAARQNLVIACVDIVVRNKKGEILLGKRTHLPQKDWWIIGGRMNPGESFEQAGARHLKRELGLDIDISRFSYLTAISTFFNEDAPELDAGGVHTVSFVVAVAITDEEIVSMQPNDEYSSIAWLTPEAVIEGDYHGALKQCTQSI